VGSEMCIRDSSKFDIKNLLDFSKIDLGSDNVHAGINSHSAYANKLYKMFTDIN
jgi:hypothetical protein